MNLCLFPNTLVKTKCGLLLLLLCATCPVIGVSDEVSMPLVDPKTIENRSFEIQETLSDLAKRSVELDLKELSKATPDGYFQRLLDNIETLRAGMLKDAETASPETFESDFQQLTRLVRSIKMKQQLRYTLWAERIYRQVSESTDTKQTKKHYMLLSQINTDLLVEPSLSRAIVQQLFALYDAMDKSDKQEVRYKAIQGFEGRKGLENF